MNSFQIGAAPATPECIDHGGVICVAYPDTHHQVRIVSDRPIVAVVVGRARFGRCWKRQVQDRISTEHGCARLRIRENGCDQVRVLFTDDLNGFLFFGSEYHIALRGLRFG